jgi:hypothetical protein
MIKALIPAAINVPWGLRASQSFLVRPHGYSLVLPFSSLMSSPMTL